MYSNDYSRVKTELSELSALSLTLYMDVFRCAKEFNKGNSNFWARAFCRAFFTFVDAITYRLKLVILAAEEDQLISLKLSEYAFLNETSYSINNKGIIKESKKYIPFINNFNFVLKTFFRSFQIEDKLNEELQKQGYHSFLVSIELRNRLTHPKNVYDLSLNEQEKKHMIDAWEWYEGLVNIIFSENII